jgi:RhtB (resistance to homoserine/threonine) family protein
VQLDLAPYLAISILLILIPGPDTAIVTKNALLAGRRGGVFAAVGVTAGLAIWTLAAALGVAALLRASAVAFLVLKIAGALYLVWLGIQLLRAPGAGISGPAGAVAPPPDAGRRALRQGLISDLGNPKIAVFFTSFLPQFVGSDSAALPSLLVLGAIFCVLTLAWLAAYGALVGEGAQVLRRPSVRRALDRFTGVVLIGFGIRLAFEHR